MNTFAERLKVAIGKRGISQAEAARLCGIAQQSLNYIITNNLTTSKLAPQIASSLGINPEWLIFGHGKFEETKIYEIPIIHSPYMLKKFLNNEIDKNSMEYTVIDASLGDSAFAYLLEAKKMAICSMEAVRSGKSDFLNFKDSVVTISEDEKGGVSFPIFEWRIRSVDY